MGLTAPRTTIGSPFVTPPPRVFRSVDPAAGLATPLDDVVDLRPEAPGLLEPEPDLDALHDVDAHDGGGERGVEAGAPLDIAAQPDRCAVHDDLEHATDGVAVRPRLVDLRDHPSLGVRVGTPKRRRVRL